MSESARLVALSTPPVAAIHHLIWQATQLELPSALLLKGLTPKNRYTDLSISLIVHDVLVWYVTCHSVSIPNGAVTTV